MILLQVPLEIAWCATVSWEADDVTCRIMVFNRIVGIYLSGFIMIVISLDRLSAIMFPISHMSNTRRTKVMLIMAWIAAPVCALPQVSQNASSFSSYLMLSECNLPTEEPPSEA